MQEAKDASFSLTWDKPHERNAKPIRTFLYMSKGAKVGGPGSMRRARR